MCEFVSWVEYDEKLFYLTASDLRTKDGRMLLRPSVIADISGHGAIREYYPELHGHGYNMECTNFSSPSNFPPEIAAAIKAGKFRGVGYNEDLLTLEASKKNKTVLTGRDRAYYASRDKLQNALAAAQAEYDDVRITRDEYNGICDAAWAERDKADRAILAEYEKKMNALFWDLFEIPENRAEAWR